MSDESDEVETEGMPEELVQLLTKLAKIKDDKDDFFFHTGRVSDAALAKVMFGFAVGSERDVEIRIKTLRVLTNDQNKDAITNHAAFEASLVRDGIEVSSFKHMRIDGALAGLARAALLSFFEDKIVTPQQFDEEANRVHGLIKDKHDRVSKASEAFKEMKLSEQDKKDLELN